MIETSSEAIIPNNDNERGLRFFADTTLGATVRWLRIMGFSCIVCSDLRPDHLSFPIHPQSGDVILTRQRALPAKIKKYFPDYHCLFVTANDRRSQLQQIIGELDLKRPQTMLNQCLRCGVLLKTVNPSAIIERVPPYIAETAESFQQCPSCGKIYWPGTHTRRMLDEIKLLFDSDKPDHNEYFSTLDNIDHAT